MMTMRVLTASEEAKLAEAFEAEAVAMGLKPNATLPREVKRRVRVRVLAAIDAERAAKTAQAARRKAFEQGENTFTWSGSVSRRR
jgi:hypothetical protein